MTQFTRSIVWLFTAFFVSVAALAPASVEDLIGEAVEAAAGRSTAPDTNDLDDDRDVPTRTAPNNASERRTLEGGDGLRARRVPLGRSAQAQPHHGLVLSQVLPSVSPRLIPLRL